MYRVFLHLSLLLAVWSGACAADNAQLYQELEQRIAEAQRTASRSSGDLGYLQNLKRLVDYQGVDASANVMREALNVYRAQLKLPLLQASQPPAVAARPTITPLTTQERTVITSNTGRGARVGEGGIQSISESASGDRFRAFQAATRQGLTYVGSTFETYRETYAAGKEGTYRVAYYTPQTGFFTAAQKVAQEKDAQLRAQFAQNAVEKKTDYFRKPNGSIVMVEQSLDASGRQVGGIQNPADKNISIDGTFTALRPAGVKELEAPAEKVGGASGLSLGQLTSGTLNVSGSPSS